MSKYFSADWIFPVNMPPIKNGVVSISESGEIEAVFTDHAASKLTVEIEKHKGAIVPGFVNTHCHLELSHMHGQIPEKTGLVGFVQTVIKNRQSDNDMVIEAMKTADQQMLNNGIVAVGDISNQSISRDVKFQSTIHYHTFVEAMSFNPARADAVMENAIALKNDFLPLPASIVPHAPYSVSEKLFQLISERAETDKDFISIHNQETTDENNFFLTKTGGFLNLYKFLGLEIEFFQPTAKTSLQSWLPYVKKQKTLLVHNTVTSEEDVAFARQNHPDLYWCLCPQANLYIEDALPNVDLFIDENLKITLGTDSLASNHQLNILSEMKVLQEHKKVNFEHLLQWATINGAQFLGLYRRLGTIEVGKSPGLNLIQLSDDFTIESDKVERLS